MSPFFARFLSSRLIFNIQAFLLLRCKKTQQKKNRKNHFKLYQQANIGTQHFPKLSHTHAKDGVKTARRRTPFRPCPERNPSMSGKESVLRRNPLRGYIHPTCYQTAIYIGNKSIRAHSSRASAYRILIDRTAHPQACHTMKILHMSECCTPHLGQQTNKEKKGASGKNRTHSSNLYSLKCCFYSLCNQ